LPATLRVITSPGGIVGNILLGEQVYVPLLELANVSRLVYHHLEHIVCEHIAGTSSIAADHLSRNNVSSFFSLYPQAKLIPTPIPPSLLQIVVIPGPDWTSQHFTQLFNSIINKV